MKPIKKILFVDDEPTLIELAPLLFDEYDVLASNDAEYVFDLIDKFIPDIILLDIIMGLNNGLEICRAIKASPLHAHIPVILMTAGTLRDEFQQYGADGIIEKPFDIPLVKSLINNHLGF